MSLSSIDLFSEMSERIARLARERGEKITPDEVAAAIRELNRRQFLYRDEAPRHVEVLNRMSSQVAQFFLILGSRTVSDPMTGLFGIVPLDDVSRINLTVEETALLLALRIIYETRGKDGEADHQGRVLTTFGEILDVHATKTRRPVARPQVLEEALSRFEQANVARVISLDKDARNESKVAIMSSIAFVTGSDFVARVNAFAQNVEGAAIRSASEDKEDAR